MNNIFKTIKQSVRKTNSKKNIKNNFAVQLQKCTNDYPLFSYDGSQEKLCKIVDVYDGDSFTACFFDEGMNNIIKYKCRASGYDSPEMRPKKTKENRDEEIKRAKEARLKFIEFSNCENDLVKIRLGKFDKYGRILAYVYNLTSDIDISVNDKMIQEGYGYEYSGGTKKDF